MTIVLSKTLKFECVVPIIGNSTLKPSLLFQKFMLLLSTILSNVKRKNKNSS